MEIISSKVKSGFFSYKRAHTPEIKAAESEVPEKDLYDESSLGAYIFRLFFSGTKDILLLRETISTQAAEKLGLISFFTSPQEE